MDRGEVPLSTIDLSKCTKSPEKLQCHTFLWEDIFCVSVQNIAFVFFIRQKFVACLRGSLVKLILSVMSRWTMVLTRLCRRHCRSTCIHLIITPLGPSVLQLEPLSFQGMFSLGISCMGLHCSDWLSHFWSRCRHPHSLFQQTCLYLAYYWLDVMIIG